MLGSSPARYPYTVRDLTPNVPIFNEMSRQIPTHCVFPFRFTLQSTHGDFSYTISTILYSQNTHLYERVAPIKIALNTAPPNSIDKSLVGVGAHPTFRILQCVFTNSLLIAFHYFKSLI